MNDLAPPFYLSPSERNNPLWVRLKGHLEQKLCEARGKLEGDQTEQQTAICRGRILALKAILALGDELPPQDG